MPKTNAFVNLVENLRSRLSSSAQLTQPLLDDVYNKINPLKQKLMPDETDELLVIVDASGNRLNLHAPRWMCHLFGLRHLCVHVLIRLLHPTSSDLFVFQVRSWNKFDAPGCIDISVSGHVTDNLETEKAAFKEMKEEIGLAKEDLISSKLTFYTSYERYDENRELNFYNREFKKVYMGAISHQGLSAVRFNDNEVVGLYLCPQDEISNRSSRTTIPLASGLRGSLPYVS